MDHVASGIELAFMFDVAELNVLTGNHVDFIAGIVARTPALSLFAGGTMGLRTGLGSSVIHCILTTGGRERTAEMLRGAVISSI